MPENNFVSYADATDLMTGISTKLKQLNGAYVPRGNSTFANLPTVLTKAMSGYVYNVTDEFTTDSRFVEPTGKTCPAGTNVAIIDNGTISYTEVTPEGSENPSEEGWYEESAGVYTLSVDTTVDGSKTYYEQTITVDMKYDIIGTFVDVSAISDEIEKVSDMVSTDDFDDTADYAVGDIVKHENTLYKFNSAHTAGDWDSSEVDAVTVMDVIGDFIHPEQVNFTAFIGVDTDCTILKAGIVATHLDNADIIADPSIASNTSSLLDATNAEYVRYRENIDVHNVAYTWTKSHVTSDQTWIVKAYVVYEDAEGNEHTEYGDPMVYSNIYRCTAKLDTTKKSPDSLTTAQINSLLALLDE